MYAKPKKYLIKNQIHNIKHKSYSKIIIKKIGPKNIYNVQREKYVSVS